MLCCCSSGKVEEQTKNRCIIAARKFRMEKRFAQQMYYNHDHHPYFVIAYMIDKDELDSVHTIIIIQPYSKVICSLHWAVFNQLVIKDLPLCIMVLFCFQYNYKLISILVRWRLVLSLAILVDFCRLAYVKVPWNSDFFEVPSPLLSWAIRFSMTNMSITYSNKTAYTPQQMQYIHGQNFL